MAGVPNSIGADPPSLTWLGLVSAAGIVVNGLAIAEILGKFGHSLMPWVILWMLGVAVFVVDLIALWFKDGSRLVRWAMVIFVATWVTPFTASALGRVAKDYGYFDRVRILQPDGSWREVPKLRIYPHMK